MRRIAYLFLLVLFGLFALYGLKFQRSAPVRTPYIVQTADDPDTRVYLDPQGKVLEVVRDGGREPAPTESEPDQGYRREPAEGLPVPVIPGSRTTEARVEPPSPSRPIPPPPSVPRRTLRRVAPAVPRGDRPRPDLLTVTGRLSATEQRARDDARNKLEDILTDRLAPEVPRTWKVPPELIDGMIRETIVRPHQRDYGTVYEATLKVDLSPAKRAEIVAAYHREEVMNRLALLGALFAFVLACLAAVAGYIRADEASQGYYTARLRVAAAAGVAAAGGGLFWWLFA